MPVLIASDLLRVAEMPIDPAEITAFVDDQTAGGRVVFEGVVRDHHDGHAVRYLEYEAYAEMAVEQIAKIAGEMRERWPLIKIAIVHRVGCLEIGQIAVCVAVSSVHRAEAFEACRYGIDRVKDDVAIWKREFYFDGTASWQENHC